MVSAEGILFIFGTVFTNTGESLFTLIFCLPLTYQIVSEKFSFKIPKIYKECIKQFLQRAETWRNCSNYWSFLIFEPNLQVLYIYMFYGLTCLLISKNVYNDLSMDSPIVDQSRLHQCGSPAVRLSDQSAAPEILQSFI